MVKGGLNTVDYNT